jgi:hypothetical protein
METDDLLIAERNTRHYLVNISVLTVGTVWWGMRAQRRDLGGETIPAVDTPPDVGQHLAGYAEEPGTDRVWWRGGPLPPGNGERLGGDVISIGC